MASVWRLSSTSTPSASSFGNSSPAAAPREHLDVVVGVPLRRTERQRCRVLSGDEQLGEPDAVVGELRLPADQRHRDAAVTLPDGLDGGLARDAASDDDDAL